MGGSARRRSTTCAPTDPWSCRTRGSLTGPGKAKKGSSTNLPFFGVLPCFLRWWFVAGRGGQPLLIHLLGFRRAILARPTCDLFGSPVGAAEVRSVCAALDTQSRSASRPVLSRG